MLVVCPASKDLMMENVGQQSVEKMILVLKEELQVERDKRKEAEEKANRLSDQLQIEAKEKEARNLEQNVMSRREFKRQTNNARRAQHQSSMVDSVHDRSGPIRFNDAELMRLSELHNSSGSLSFFKAIRAIVAPILFYIYQQ